MLPLYRDWTRARLLVQDGAVRGLIVAWVALAGVGCNSATSGSASDAFAGTTWNGTFSTPDGHGAITWTFAGAVVHDVSGNVNVPIVSATAALNGTSYAL